MQPPGAMATPRVAMPLDQQAGRGYAEEGFKPEAGEVLSEQLLNPVPLT